MRLLDAHLHVWDPAARHHAWLAEHPPLQRRFELSDYDPGRHEVGGVIAVQADCRDEEALDEVAWLARIDDNRIRGIVAYAPLHLGTAARPTVDAVAAEPLVVGVRRLLQHEPERLFDDPALRDGIRLLAECALPFDLCVVAEQLPAVARLARACPDVQFVLDHLGKPRELDPWRADIAALAARPNVACKLSGLATEIAGDHRPYLEHALECFGPERCMVGSDWPVLTLATSAQEWFDAVEEVLGALAAHEREAVCFGTATATYGVPLTTPGAASAGSRVHR